MLLLRTTINMIELPDELLHQIVRQVLEKLEGLRLWCKLSSTCRRLWSFQLPPEPTYFLDESLTLPGPVFCSP